MFGKVKVADDRRTISVEIEGEEVLCREGDTVAAVLLLNGAQPYRRSILSRSERAPYCMMGVCFECLVQIDGVPNQQGCLRNVEQGMRISRQLAIRTTLAERRSRG